MFKIFRVSTKNFEFGSSQSVDISFLSPLLFLSPFSLSLADSPLSARAGIQAQRACARCRAAPLPALARCPAAWPHAADAPPHLSAHAVLAAPCPLTHTPRQAHGDAPPRRRGAQTGRPCPAEPLTAASLHCRAPPTLPTPSLRPDPPSRPLSEHATARRARAAAPFFYSLLVLPSSPSPFASPKGVPPSHSAPLPFPSRAKPPQCQNTPPPTPLPPPLELTVEPLPPVPLGPN